MKMGNKKIIYKTDDSRTWLEDEEGEEVAVLEHPEIRRGVVNIRYIYVDTSLTGQDISGKMMKLLAERLKKKKKRAELSCSYAIRWFAEHPEYDDIVITH